MRGLRWRRGEGEEGVKGGEGGWRGEDRGVKHTKHTNARNNEKAAGWGQDSESKCKKGRQYLLAQSSRRNERRARRILLGVTAPSIRAANTERERRGCGLRGKGNPEANRPTNGGRSCAHREIYEQVEETARRGRAGAKTMDTQSASKPTHFPMLAIGE